MSSRVRKWLRGSFKAEMRRDDLLVIILLGVIISLIWPSLPAWAFFVLGFVVSVTQRAARDIRCWLRRRRTA